jgi:hypothetical protein
MGDGSLVWDHPLLPLSVHGECEPPPGASCDEADPGGQVWVNVWQGREMIWRFLVVRPSASSGTNGSGVELQDVDYRGTRVLRRAHTPILNVEYEAEGIEINCGPVYRDWLNAESCFEAFGDDIVPGIRMCSSPAKTILDTKSDSGDFRGVAVYVHGQEVVLVSEMNAGWYRYVSEWRLRSDGRIRPRFGFAGVANPCTCKPHHHHVYWRLDFDIRTYGNNVVQEINELPPPKLALWVSKTFEGRRPKDPAAKRRWRVLNSETGEGYLIVPGPNDGTRTPFGVGDIWVLRYHIGEIDDGVGVTKDPAKARAHIDVLATPPELVEDTDVVVWYAAHFRHDEEHGSVLMSHVVGPDLIPIGL